ncbi:inactive protein RESTRICTED TEV MOVEMENT 2-like [Senna tora]|uniref:Inactive protein RESTRICTED TEV MOVEMENT 2-like n=1 Tax=Senna tora TaxID=362788 RepID=A0A834SKR1_9FABA|nr:inactive protein RESTRICTED TEV MOVEMENT 2-like [Senna tora]
MASVRGSRRVGVRTSTHAPVVEDIVPNSGWTEDSMGHYLLVDLPGFKKEEVKLQVEGSGYITVRGERQVNEEKRVRFELIFPVPKDSDMDKIVGKFDGEILYVTVIKRNAQEVTKETEPASAKPAITANGSVERPQEYKREEESISGHREEERISERVHHTGFSEEFIRKWEREPSILTNAVEVLRKNKGIIITAVLAFNLGVLVSRKFQSS